MLANISELSIELFSIQAPVFTSLLLLLAYSIGSIIYRLSSFSTIKDAFLDVFSKCLIGLLAIILAYAAFITKGITIQWGFLLVGLLAVWAGRRLGYLKQGNPLFKFDKSHLYSFLVLQFLALVLFFLQGYLFYNTSFNNLPHGDYNFYSGIIEGYTLYGIETRDTMIDVVNTAFYSPGFYHHSELWLASLYYKVLNVSSIEAQVTGIFPLLGAVLAIGFIALARAITEIKFIQILAPLFIFFSGIPIWEIMPQIHTFVLGAGDNTKNIMTALLILPAFILVIKQNHIFFIPLLALPIVNVVNLPAFYGTLMLFGVAGYSYSFFKNPGHKYMLWFPLIVIVFIALFYSIVAQFFPEKPTSEFSLSEIISGIKEYPQRPFLIFGGAIVIVSFLYLLHAAIALVFIKSVKNFRFPIEYKYLGILVLSVNLIGLSTWCVTNILKDSVQFHCIPGIISINIFAFAVFAYLIRQLKGTKKYKYAVFALLALIGLNYYSLKANNEFLSFYELGNRRSLNYLEQINDSINDGEIILVGHILNPNKLSGYWAAVPYHQPNFFLKSLRGQVRQVSLTTLEIPVEKFEAQARATVEREVANAPFTRFVNNLKKEGKFNSIGQAQALFIQEHNIDFLLIDAQTPIPEEINPLIEEIIQDENSGEKFAVIKKSK